MWLTARTRTASERSRTVAGSLAALLVAALLSACSSPAFAPGGSGDLPTPGDAPRARDRIHQQAQDALVRWADAVRDSGGAAITFVGELTSQIGTWEVDVGENNKEALMAGLVESMTDLPADPPSRREVKWLDDTKIGVNLMSARATLDELVASGEGVCAECDPLRVTEATLATGLVDTSRGPAEVPMWVYGLAGTSVRISRVAVDESVTVVPPPWNADDPPVGISIDWARGAAESRDLIVGFVGAAGDATKPCGADYSAEAVESELAVVVIVVEDRNPAPGACTLEGHGRTAEVRLDSRLGDRVVLEVRQGLPVAVEVPQG